MWIITVLILLLIGLWAYAEFVLSGPDHSNLDDVHDAAINQGEPPSQAHLDVVAFLGGSQAAATAGDKRSLLHRLRERMDTMGDQADLQGISITPVNNDMLCGEWVMSTDADPDKRLLYIHGGAFTVGSPRSHRTITTELSRRLGVTVFALDYRLMPEHKRLEGLADCQSAYDWVMAHGPTEATSATKFFVAGDSAGGNLTLVLAAWARDTQRRPADAMLAIAPATDSTFASPTLASNMASDPMLGPALGRMNKIPRTVLLWFSWLGTRVKPADPRISPLHGDLANLPPILVHASEAEMLLDDARRYATKARRAGSPIQFATWQHMVHVWHIFEPTLPEAKQAFTHIHNFFQPYLD